MGINRKYLNIFNFYGDRDRDLQENWKTYLEVKFRQSTVLFLSKLEKINYVRDHYKNMVFNVIKTRVDPTSSDLYTYIQKMIIDFHYIFREFDKVISSDAKIYDPNFKIDTINKDETFDIFYTRFYAKITLFNYNNN